MVKRGGMRIWLKWTTPLSHRPAFSRDRVNTETPSGAKSSWTFLTKAAKAGVFPRTSTSWVMTTTTTKKTRTKGAVDLTKSTERGQACQLWGKSPWQFSKKMIILIWTRTSSTCMSSISSQATSLNSIILFSRAKLEILKKFLTTN